ncbi:MAG: sugar phosphate nucleotidyltransferase, partial [Actinomycetota bacterium]|nr:sugar phosphate nucleotidyltransferase [Actinomycetota bacterium]
MTQASRTQPRTCKVVIPVAGLGTRFLPATKAVPKELLPVVDKPALQYIVEEAVRAGLTEVLMVTG